MDKIQVKSGKRKSREPTRFNFGNKRRRSDEELSIRSCIDDLLCKVSNKNLNILNDTSNQIEENKQEIQIKSSSQAPKQAADENLYSELLKQIIKTEPIEFPRVRKKRTMEVLNTTYCGAIIDAMDKSPYRKITLDSIYLYFVEEYNFLRKTRIKWKKCIRETLKTHNYFIRSDIDPHQDEGSQYWLLLPTYEYSRDYSCTYKCRMRVPTCPDVLHQKQLEERREIKQEFNNQQIMYNVNNTTNAFANNAANAAASNNYKSCTCDQNIYQNASAPPYNNNTFALPSNDRRDQINDPDCVYQDSYSHNVTSNQSISTIVRDMYSPLIQQIEQCIIDIQNQGPACSHDVINVHCTYNIRKGKNPNCPCEMERVEQNSPSVNTRNYGDRYYVTTQYNTTPFETVNENEVRELLPPFYHQGFPNYTNNNNEYTQGYNNEYFRSTYPTDGSQGYYPNCWYSPSNQ